jgi:uncharacterized protein
MLIRADDQIRMPWKNGGGVTSEVARSPAGAGDDFDWRISIAEVAAGGPFSSFPGIDRVIIRLGEAPLVLDVEGEERALVRFEPFGFPGEATTSAALPGGPTRDLNVMTRRGHTTAAVSVRRLDAGDRFAPPDGGRLAVIVLEGALVLESGEELGQYDALVGDADEALRLRDAEARIVLAELG